jgi:hypothetical protein
LPFVKLDSSIVELPILHEQGCSPENRMTILTWRRFLNFCCIGGKTPAEMPALPEEVGVGGTDYGGGWGGTGFVGVVADDDGGGGGGFLHG